MVRDGNSEMGTITYPFESTDLIFETVVAGYAKFI
jgi:hypothetical protein